MRTTRLAALALPALLLLGASTPQRTGQTGPTYDPAADARAAVTQATHTAAKKHKRVLLVWGHDGNARDVELYKKLRRGKTPAWPYYYEYEIVPIDRGADGAHNAELARALGATGTGALLTVLDSTGKALANGAATELAADDATLGRFLAQYAVEPLDAEKMMKRALEAAKAEKKRVFVHLGAPW